MVNPPLLDTDQCNGCFALKTLVDSISSTYQSHIIPARLIHSQLTPGASTKHSSQRFCTTLHRGSRAYSHRAVGYFVGSYKLYNKIIYYGLCIGMISGIHLKCHSDVAGQRMSGKSHPGIEFRCTYNARALTAVVYSSTSGNTTNVH